MSDSKSAPESRVAEHLAVVPRSGIRDFFEIVSTRQDVISLGIGEPDFVTPWHIREESIHALGRGETSYTANLGLIELRREIAAYVQRSYGVEYDPRTEVLVTVGVSEALDLAIRALINPGDEVIYHEPCYVSYAPVVAFAHGRAVAAQTCHEDGFRLKRDQLEALVSGRTKAIMLNFPTNPTGAVLLRKDLEQIADFAVRHDLIVLSDEIYSELTYEAERISIASLPGMKERTVFLNGLSKAWAMTGFRIGFACAPPGLIEAMMKIHQYTMLCAPVLGQRAAVEALRSGNDDMLEMREAYRRRRNFIHAALNEMGLNCHKPNGAFYAFPHIGHLGLSSCDFALRLLDEEKVACVPGTAFGSSGEGYLRCAYAADMEEIKEAMDRMAEFVARL